MSEPRRLPTGGLIERDKPLSFRFDGKAYTGYAGDTLASALIANGVKLVGRSFKYHRRRGIFTAGPEEPNALVTLRSGARREPNTKATTVELYDGLQAESQNCWPSLNFDVLAANQLFAPLFVGGFYYKTFMWPAAFWEKVYEPLIRRAAGLGAASGLADPDRYEHATAHCDVLVIGAGPAGLAAALAAGRAGARVILCEEDFRLGGRLLAEYRHVDGLPGASWADRAEAELATLPEVRVLRRTSVFGVYDGGTYGAIERVSDHLPRPPEHQPRQRLWQIVARRSINAMGAIERPIVFGGNDRPGVLLASALRGYVNRFAVAPAGSVAVFTSTDDGWKTAQDLLRADVPVEMVIDARPTIADELSRPVARAGTRILLDAVVADVVGAAGVRRIDVVKNGRTIRFGVDTLAVSGGFNPQIGLTTHLNGTPRWSDAISAFVPGDLPPGMIVAGAAAGHFKLADCLSEGAACGNAAAADLGFSEAVPRPAPQTTRRSRRHQSALAGRAGAPQSLRRFAERCDRARHRDRLPGRLPRRRAFEALHHARHGDRAGQDLEPQRPCAAWRIWRAKASPQPAPRASVRRMCRSRSAPSPAHTSARISRRRARRRDINGRSTTARPWSRPGNGCGRVGSRSPARRIGSKA